MHKFDVTLLVVRFAVTIVQPPFASLEIDLFVRCVDGKNVLHVTVSNVVLVSLLRIGQNIC